MAKKKKTLKQKKLTELRHLREDTTPSSPISEKFSYTFSSVKTTVPAIQMTSIYSLQHDLRKTLFVSFAILIFLYTLSVLLKSHVFVLPLVSIRY